MPYLNKLFLLLILAASCTETQPAIDEVTSLRINLSSPVSTGSHDARLPDADTMVTFDVSAIDADGNVAVDFNNDVNIHVHFLGSLTPDTKGAPFVVLPMQNGVSAQQTIQLPAVFGATYIWAEDSEDGDNATFAVGTSEKLWYRDPFLRDISQPLDETALDALENAPLQSKQVIISNSRHGDNGKLVVTGVYAQGYTVSDVDCTTLPCTSDDYDHLFIFSFSRADDENGSPIRIGQLMSEISGGISDFNGLTEMNFPESKVRNLPIDESAIPAPALVEQSWFTNEILFERAEGGLVAIENAEVCPLDDAFTIFGQWRLNLGSGCGNDSVSVISAGQVPSIDPTTFVGQTLPRVVGTLRPVNIGSFNVWIIHPRFAEDVQLN